MCKNVLLLVIRSNRGGNTGSHLNSEVKHLWAYLVVGWWTTCEPYVLNNIFFIYVSTLVYKYIDIYIYIYIYKYIKARQYGRAI